MPTEKLLLTAAITAACLAVGGVAFAGQPADIEQRRCSNNGNGNGGEKVNTQTFGGTVTDCEKFTTDGEDQPGAPGVDDTDPNPK